MRTGGLWGVVEDLRYRWTMIAVGGQWLADELSSYRLELLELSTRGCHTIRERVKGRRWAICSGEEEISLYQSPVSLGDLVLVVVLNLVGVSVLDSWMTLIVATSLLSRHGYEQECEHRNRYATKTRISPSHSLLMDSDVPSHP